MWIFGKGPLRLFLALLHIETWMNKVIVAHAVVGKIFACKIGYLIRELDMTSCD